MTTGDLFTRERWRAIWKLNSGAFDDAIRKSSYVVAGSFSTRPAIVNTTGRPEATVYVWNAGQRGAYVIDTQSSKGKAYTVQWRVTTSGPALLSAEVVQQGASKPEPLPPPSQIVHFDELADAGRISMGVAFSSSLAPGDADIFELQYHYRRQGERFLFMRDPLEMQTYRFPLGKWEATSIAATMNAMETTFEE